MMLWSQTLSGKVFTDDDDDNALAGDEWALKHT